MRREYALITLVLLVASTLRHACMGENTNMIPTIAVLHAEDDVLVVQLNNTSDQTLMVDLSRNQQGVIRCIHLLIKGTNRSVLTTNSVFADGYWTPCALESQIYGAEQYRESLVGITPASRVIFRVPIQPFLLEEAHKANTIQSVSPKLVYFTSTGSSHEVKGQFFSIATTNDIPHK